MRGGNLAVRRAANEIMSSRQGNDFNSDSAVFGVVKRCMTRSANRTRGQMKRGLNSLATIASTAPLVGFYGTCIGIVSAFKGCGGEKWACIAATVWGIAEGLVPAAIGVFAAIPAWWGYRYLPSNTRKTELPSAALTRVFLARLGARTASFALTVCVEDFEGEMQMYQSEMLSYLTKEARNRSAGCVFNTSSFSSQPRRAIKRP